MAIGTGLVLAGPAQAANFVVTTNKDPAGGTCTSGVSCSLRQAVIAANADTTPDTVVLAATTYRLTIAPSGSPPQQTNGDLDITNPVTIQGLGAGSTIINANQLDRAFTVEDTITTSPVVFNGLTITGGNNGSGTGNGGAINVNGDAPVTIQSSVVSGNHATGLQGGGAIEAGGNGLFSLLDSTVSGNMADGQGGGFDAEVGPLTVRNSTIAANKALNGGGGGIFNDAPFTALTITGSTISGNSATTEGGGISTHADATIVNTTVSGNSSGSAGGGIHVGFTSAGSSLTNVTVAFNQAPAGTGGGLVNTQNNFTVRDSIVSNDTGGECDPANLPASLGHNVVGDSSCGFTQAGDKQGVDPLLVALADNGGTTQTHALVAGSPAVDAGDNSACPATDQRGLARPFDGNFDDSAVCDAGAFELRGGPPTAATGPASAISTDGATLSGTVNPSGVPASYHFEYGPTTAYGSATPAANAGGATDQPVTATLTGLAPNTLYHYRLVASGPGGIGAGADGVFTTSAIVTPPGLPPPKEGVTANLSPVSGTVLVALRLPNKPRADAGAAAKGALPGFGPFVKVNGPAQIPIGALVSTTNGTVRLSSALRPSGGTQSGTFSQGLFIVKQTRNRALTTAVMAGSKLSACSKLPHGGAAKRVAAARSRRHRSLFANVHGRFRTRGRNSTATVRGTAFLVKDSCTGTLTKVTRGVVTVHDLALKRTRKVKAGHRYFARAPGRKRR